jgi:methylated-DNA-[protein]-cysteine S-methyltransferase
MSRIVLEDRIETPLGAMVVLADEGKLIGLSFDDPPGWVLKDLERRFSDFELRHTSDPCGFSDRIRAYFAGELAAIDEIPAKGEGTSFEMRVWTELRRIPCGETASYGEIAERVGDRNGARAVGIANHRNPVALVVPCHRVIGADGKLVGYGGGLDRKTWLLRHEGLPVHNGRIDPQADLFD